MADSLKMAVTLAMLAINIQNTNSDGLIFESRERKPYKKPEFYEETTDFILQNGYPAETHEITTPDGYILAVHRIPHGKEDDFNDFHRIRSVVLVQHGLGSSSDNWVLSGPDALPFLLADAGYDVWLANTRGNSYSHRHKNSSISSEHYWEFSFHEQAVYDLASTIDYILYNTRQAQLFYIGHSRGTTMGFVLLSMKPEYNAKIRLVVNYAPIAYLKNAEGPLAQSTFSTVSPRQLKRALQRANFNAFPTISKSVIRFRTSLCGLRSPMLQFCTNLLHLTNGNNDDILNKTLVPFYFSHFPNGCGIKEIIHFTQIARSDRFAMYDLGKGNFRKYGDNKPYEYPIERITTPQLFFVSQNDFFASKKDFEKLLRRFRTAVRVEKVQHPTFNHIDFLWGKGARKLVYEPTMNFMRNF